MGFEAYGIGEMGSPTYPSKGRYSDILSGKECADLHCTGRILPAHAMETAEYKEQ